MAFKEVTRVEIMEILRQWQAGRSIRGVARSSGVSRASVGKYVAAAQRVGFRRNGPPVSEAQLGALLQLNMAGPRAPTVPSEAVLAPWVERIEQWVAKDDLQLTRIHELLRQHGCSVSYASLHRFINRRGWGSHQRSTVRMAETKPGEVAEIDFGRLGLIHDPERGRQRLAWGMVIVLVHSRHCFVWPLFQQRLTDVVEGLEAGWAFFQGIPKYLVLDNFPAAVVGPDPLNPRLTRGLLEYAQHRGFVADPARVRHPKDKPHVERNMQFVRGRLFKGGAFLGLADLRSQARRWSLEVAGERIHGTTQKVPLVVFKEEEQAALLPWDGVPYDVPDWQKAKVHPDHHISYRYSLYSAPSTTCPPGTMLEVRGDGKLVRLYHRGTLVKVHPRVSRGGRVTDPEDYPAALTAYTTRAPDRILREAAALGPTVGTFAQRLLSGPLPWAKLRQGQKLLRLGDRYTAKRLEAACIRALAVDLIDVRRLERILVEALEQETQPSEALAAAAPEGRFSRPGSSFSHSAAAPTVDGAVPEDRRTA